MNTFQKFTIGLDEEEKQVLIPLIHTLVAGTTGVGKTEADRKIIQALRTAIPDLKVLIFDSKSTGRDWEDFGNDVKPFVKMSTDTRFLRDLIETSEERKIDFYLYELDQAAQGAKTWYDVLHNLEKRHAHFKEKHRELKEEKLGVLLIYMRGLIQGFESMKTSDKFDLSAPITVVPINYAEEAFQQLVVYTYHKEIKKRRLKHILVVHDEMHKFAPSKRGTGCRRVVEEYYQEGRAAGNFGIASDQEIVGISPTVRSQCWNWILGMQTDKAKAKRVIEHLPTGKVSIDAVMTLGVGWFFVVIRTPTETTVKKFYLLPDGITIELGKKVIRGTLSVEEIMKKLSNLRMKKEDEDLVWKEKYEEEHRIRKEFEKRLGEYSEDLNKLRKKLAEQKSPEEIEKLHKTMTQLKDEKADLEKQLEKEAKAFVKVKRKADAFENLQKALAPFIPSTPTTPATSSTSGPSFTMAEIDERINQRLAGPKAARVVRVDVNERIKELVKNDIVNRLVAKIQSLPEPAKKAALWLHEKKQAKIGELYSYMYEKIARRIPGSFYMNVVNPLQNAWLIVNEAGNVSWTLEAKLSAELKDILRNGDMQKIAKYLKSLLL